MDVERIYIGREESAAEVLQQLFALAEGRYDTRSVVWVAGERSVDVPAPLAEEYMRLRAQIAGQQVGTVGSDEELTLTVDDGVGEAPALDVEEPEPEATEVDEAAQALADEIAALRAELESLGGKVDGRWGVDRLRTEIAAAKSTGE